MRIEMESFGTGGRMITCGKARRIPLLLRGIMMEVRDVV